MANLILVSFVWAFSFVLIKGTLSGLDSNLVSFARMLLSLAVLLPFLRLAGTALRERIALVGIGAVQFGLMYAAYIATYRYLPAHVI
ncbi:MAG: EamA family transporter, partial [Chitinivibrionales bacterium]|nr:EamA family transporter [Chitinivibrionales bacterium]MBD3394841.1 EamA family transporter [Chitinivibrionales bacterium]